TRSCPLNPRPPIGSASLLQCSRDHRRVRIHAHQRRLLHLPPSCCDSVEALCWPLRSTASRFCLLQFRILVRAGTQVLLWVHAHAHHGGKRDLRPFLSTGFSLNPEGGS